MMNSKHDVKKITDKSRRHQSAELNFVTLFFSVAFLPRYTQKNTGSRTFQGLKRYASGAI